MARDKLAGSVVAGCIHRRRLGMRAAAAMAVAILAVAILALAACGQRGPLVLPNSPQAIQTKAAPGGASAPASSAR